MRFCQFFLSNWQKCIKNDPNLQKNEKNGKRASSLINLRKNKNPKIFAKMDQKKSRASIYLAAVCTYVLYLYHKTFFNGNRVFFTQRQIKFLQLFKNCVFP